MESLFRFTAPPSPCGYLPDQQWSLENEYVGQLSSAEYLQRMVEGWRRFGHVMFRPMCATCRACKPLRIRVGEFRPDRSQRRCRKLNEGVVELQIGEPSVGVVKLNLYDRYHAFQTSLKNWPEHAPKDVESYMESFVYHPFPVEEWCYYLEGRLIGVGYVDYLPRAIPDSEAVGAEGMSAIYFYYDPDERHRSLGTWNILCLIEETQRRELPYLYLGYYVQGCRSMEYKPRFVPNEIRDEYGRWIPFRS